MAVGQPFGWCVQNAAGTAVSGAKIYFYIPDTVTLRSPYTDSALSVPSANPVQADAAGYFLVYLSSELGYDIVVKSADDSITYQERTVTAGASGGDAPDDEIRLSNYAATQAGFVSAATAAIADNKWLNGEEIPITLTSLMVITLTGPLRWRNVRLQKLTQSAGDFEYSVTVNGPDFSNATTLASNAAIGASSLSVSSATNIAADGKYLLISDTDYNPDPATYGNSVAKKSEWIRVSQAYTSGTTVALQQALQSSYTTAATARIYRFLETATIEWDNVVIMGGGNDEAQGAARFNRCVVKRFSDCGSVRNAYAGFTFNLCGFESYISATIESSPLAGYGYGIEVVGCDAPLIDWVWGEHCRHVVTRGSSFTTTLPFAGGNVVILGRGGSTGSVMGLRSTGSVDDVHTGHVGHNIGEVSGDLVPGNTQEAVTVESHAISYGSIRVTGADLPVSVLYYGHPSDEPNPAVKFGTVDVGYGGSSTNQALIVLNRDAQTRNTFHVHADVVEGRYPGGVNATAVQGPVFLTIDKAILFSRTTHTVSAISSANGQAFITIQNPWLIEDSANAAIYAVNAEGDLYEAANAGVFGAIVELGNGTIGADNTAFRANDAQIRLNGTRGTASKSLAGIGTVLTPNEVKSSSVATGSAISLTTTTAANITTISLEPGVWRVTGQVAFNPAGTTSITRLVAAISQTSATIPASDTVGGGYNSVSCGAYVPGVIVIGLDAGDAIVTLTATTTYYLVTRGDFTIAALTAFGKIQATRLS
jgi:hypothetical protein